MRIAIYGTGGVGGYFGGRLVEAGHDVVFIARGAHLEAIRRDGLKVESVCGDFVASPALVTDVPSEAGPVDAVLVCVKAWQVRAVAADIGPLLGPDTFLVPLQNGVEAADDLAAGLGPERVLGGLCRILSYVAGPGRICHAGVSPVVEIGERGGGHTERVAALRAAFEKARGLTVLTPDDIEVASWEKFLFIAPLSGVGAATRAPVGVIRSVPETRAMLHAATTEVFTLARARGVALGADAVDRTLAYVDSLPAGVTASMARDIVEGRPSELEHQTGTVVRLGRAAGVAVPVNECLYRTLLPADLEARGALRISG
jgi:2-dehydropantoate 2-reductase